MKTILYSAVVLGGTWLLGLSDEPHASQRSQKISQTKIQIPSKVDPQGFLGISQEAMKYRKSRLVDLGKFNAMAKEKNTVILDTRSKWAYDAFHIKGAIHMNFSDFTASKLAQLIPDKNTRILIYCNNNFDAPKRSEVESKLPELALNIPTFFNLYGYGFKNLYELSETVKVTDKRLEYVEQKK